MSGIQNGVANKLLQKRNIPMPVKGLSICLYKSGLSSQEEKSFSYDYARDFDKENGIREMPTGIPKGHYEFDTSSNDEPFWEPASVEDDLRNQLQDLSISPSGLL